MLSTVPCLVVEFVATNGAETVRSLFTEWYSSADFDGAEATATDLLFSTVVAGVDDSRFSLTFPGFSILVEVVTAGTAAMEELDGGLVDLEGFVTAFFMPTERRSRGAYLTLAAAKRKMNY